MRNNQFKYLFLSLFLITVFSCEKSEVPIYQQKAGVYFSSIEYPYSFIEDQTAVEKTIKLPVTTSGVAVDYDRKISVRIPAKDTLTTASSDQYELGQGIIKAGSYDGSIDFKINYDKRLDDSIYVVNLEIVPSDQFPETLNRNTIKVSFTKKIIKPANWDRWLKYYFGVPYSTAWWKFIMKVTGKPSLPYFPKQDPEIWWMSVGEVQANQALVRLALEKFNASPEGPLLHDDGEYKTQKVEMP